MMRRIPVAKTGANMAGKAVGLKDLPPADRRRAEDDAPARLARRRREILVETAEALLSGADPDCDVMPRLFESLAAEKMVDGTLGYIVTEMEEGMKLGFMEGFDRAMIQRCLTLDFGQAVCGTVAVTRTPMHVTDIQGSLDPMTDLVRRAGINAYACEPLLAGDACSAPCPLPAGAAAPSLSTI